MSNILHKCLLPFLFLPIVTLNAAGGGIGGIYGGHRGNITAIIHTGDTVITSDEDGFIVIWDIENETSVTRFQLTPYRIAGMVKHPLKNKISIIEAIDMNNYRISAWDLNLKTRLFSIHSYQPVSFINYSANGSFIFAAGFNGPHLTLINPDCGTILSTVDIPEGNVTFGTTGRGERNIMLYQSRQDDFFSLDGRIMYIDIVSQELIGSFDAPAGFLNPILFDNNRFLAGINSDGLLIVNAATGEIINYMENIERNALLFPAADGFFSLSRENNNLLLCRFNMIIHRGILNRNSTVFREQKYPLFFAVNNTYVFTGKSGGLFRIIPARQQERIIPFSFNFQSNISEIAAGKTNIAVFTENKELFFLPLNYELLTDNQILYTLPFTQHTNITALNNDNSPIDQFIIWQNTNTQTAAQIVNSNNEIKEINLIFLFNRFTLRSLSSANNRLLAMNSAGNISVFNLNNLTPNADFNFSSIGAIDAIIVDENHFLLSRSVTGGQSPFLLVNYNTGETVPIHYPAGINVNAGITAYAGRSGNIFAAAAERHDTAMTRIITFTKEAAASVSSLILYHGEEIILSIAESSGNTAMTIGSEGAQIYPDIIAFERTSGLPLRLLGDDRFFIALDSEGNISWHDNNSGEILAIFRIYKDTWTLLQGERKITGSFSQNYKP